MGVKQPVVQDKLRMAKLLKKNSLTKASHPKTVSYNRENLQEMTKKFSMLYLKPINGCQSKNIIRITSNPQSGFTAITGKRKQILPTEEELYQQLNHWIKQKKYIIQQGIHSITPSGDPFDIRAHVLKVAKKWIVCGVAGRIAPPEGIVTSYRHGGTSTRLNHLFETLKYDQKSDQKVRKKIKKLVLTIAKVVNDRYPAKKEFAIDLGLDQDKNIWIYEVNYMKPAINTFRKADPKIYRRILKLRKRAIKYNTKTKAKSA
ncbi:YheC/YheD family protein [Desmospora activa]|uniref:YheC/D-like protein n=1 Tax=Desmospora activa DSM 45169 TaxID=1121389 RepID=A0A2T4ZCE7_9BACL|nr:YheC/YheD family protein [Desmospora activa]PTM59567.1 YheC/D-like protein [Desmospora activa DSM 45169]